MWSITGIISDKNGKAMNKVSVILMDKNFKEITSTMTNKDGEYCLNPEGNHYPFMVAFKDYKEKYLEFWCHNINLNKDIVINGSIDKLEIYGLHCFRILGAYPSLTVYFRPMSLEKYNNGEADISPNITNDSIKAFINNEDIKILKVNKIKEYCGDTCLTAYLMQVSLPEGLLHKSENLLDIEILDLDGFFGQASIFF
ncbi:MAG: carboxypeptidase-like regulatory domain-containing protein [Tissierella sp.]|uniref:carboxypeptidase-like regulatory domain-containing protein n=1 Tax=Tissierella sp. TaxID=41274 RepID=UPI003F965B4B